MELGQSSRPHEDDDDDEVWAKLVPTDTRYQEIELRSQDNLICSEVSDSSTEKFTWCEISGNSDHDSARIRNLSSNEIIVDGTTVGEEAVDIKSGSQVTSGPHKQGFLSYTFQVVPSQKLERKGLKISLDIEHAKCSICLNIWHDVVTVAPCLHNFCNGCFSEWLRRSSTQSHDKHKSVLCPQCRAIVHSVGRNHFLRNIEEAILQKFSSLKRSDEEIAQLDTYASFKSDLVLGIKKKTSRKRSLSSLSDEGSDAELPCPQCAAAAADAPPSVAFPTTIDIMRRLEEISLIQFEMTQFEMAAAQRYEHERLSHYFRYVAYEEHPPHPTRYSHPLPPTGPPFQPYQDPSQDGGDDDDDGQE